MSGIVGSSHNIRGSGIVAKLGTDGQVFTSAGAGLKQGFEAAAGGAHTLLNTTTVSSAVASVTINPPFSSTYFSYLIRIEKFIPDTDCAIFLTFLEADDSETTTDYWWGGSGVTSNGGSLVTGHASVASEVNFMGGTNASYLMETASLASGYFTLYGPQTGTATSGTAELVWENGAVSARSHIHNVAFMVDDTTVFTQFKIAANTGNIDSAVIKTYGVS